MIYHTRLLHYHMGYSMYCTYYMYILYMGGICVCVCGGGRVRGGWWGFGGGLVCVCVWGGGELLGGLVGGG